MFRLYLEFFLKIKISEMFGILPISINNSINFIKFKNVISNSKIHHNNLIGKVSCYNFNFYYIPFELIENYEINKIGIPICNDMYVCPFCFCIQLPLEEQIKLYNILNKSEERKKSSDSESSEKSRESEYSENSENSEKSEKSEYSGDSGESGESKNSQNIKYEVYEEYELSAYIRSKFCLDLLYCEKNNKN